MIDDQDQSNKARPGDWRSRGGEEDHSVLRQSRGWFGRGYLPHYDKNGIIQHVTVHLADSLPRKVVEKIDFDIQCLPEEQAKIQRRKRLHQWIDAGYGSCHMRRPDVAKIVQEALLFFHEDRYRVHAWVVMPNHFHVLFQPINGWDLSKIVGSWKKYTARRIINFIKKLSERSANQEIDGPRNTERVSAFSVPVWHREYWDRFIRDKRHYSKTIDYIHNNPVTAKLVRQAVDWPWSSAGKYGE